MKRLLTNFSFWLVVIIIFAVGIRFLSMFSLIVDGEIRYAGDASWYYIHMAEWDYQNFPRILTYDVYQPRQYPASYVPLFPLAIAWLSKLTTIPIPWVASFLPPLSVIPTLIYVYLLAKALFKSKFIAIFSVLFVAFLPSQYLTRSVFANPDHHPFEVLFTVATLYYFVRKRFVLAGVMTGLLMLTWEGGIFLPAIIGFAEAIAWIQVLLGYRDAWDSRGYVQYIVTGGLFALFPLTFLNHPDAKGTALRLLVLCLFPFILSAISRIPNFRYRIGGLGLVVAGGIGLSAIIKLSGESVLSNSLTLLETIFVGWGVPIKECQPASLMTWLAGYSLSGVVFGIGILLTRGVVNLHFVVWSLVMFAANLGQQRWGYYFIVPVAVFTSYFVVFVAPRFKNNRYIWMMGFMCWSLVPFLMPVSIAVAKGGPSISPDMYSALTWLKENTLESTDYKVLSWWDYGHQIISVARRVPVTSPSNQYSPYQYVLRAQSEEDVRILHEARIKYLILTKDMVSAQWYPGIVAGFPVKGLIQDKPNLLAYPPKSSLVWQLWNLETFWGFTRTYQNETVKIYRYGE